MIVDHEPKTARSEALRALHVPGAPVVLPNAWDVASARAFAHAGYPAIATTSGGVLEALGYQDGGTAPGDEAIAAVRRIASGIDIPVTADLEAGYGWAADEVIARLLDAGAVGFNFEDTDHPARTLVGAAAQSQRIAALVDAAARTGVPVVVNARIDTFLRGGRIEDAVDRARRYRDAGADCVYPIGMSEERDIERLVDAGGIVNVLLRRGVPPVSRLAEFGVARVTFGSGLFRRALAAALELAREASDPPPT